MLIPRVAEACILCLNGPPFPDGSGFSEEHVIPAALGGVLTCKFLCKSCNDGFGHGFEARAKTDPQIRMAIHNLRNQLPSLFASIEEGQAHKINTAVGVLPGTFRAGEVLGRTQKMSDNSIMTTEKDTHQRLGDIMRKNGYSQEEINGALKRFEFAPDEQAFDVVPGITVVKRVAIAGGPDFSAGSSLDALVCLKIAYEFAALLFGRPVFSDNPALNQLRQALREEDSRSPAFSVEPLMAEKYAAFHGIAFEGNDLHAKFQIRLFGRLAYRVHFPNLSFDHRPVVYTHDLEANTERLD